MASTAPLNTRSIMDEILRSIGQLSIITLSSPGNAAFSRPKPKSSICSNSRHDSAVKRLLVTLHFFFPHELLPALDLIDRGVVRGLVLRDANFTLSDGNDKRGDGVGLTETEDGLVRDTGPGEERIKASPSATRGNPAHPISPRPPPLRPKETNNITTPTPRRPGIEVWYVQSASAITDNRAQPIKTQNSSRPNVVGGSSHTHGGGHGRYRNALRASNTFYEVRLDSWNCSCAAFAFGVLKGMGLERSTSSEGDELGRKKKEEEEEEQGCDGEKIGERGEKGMRERGRMGVAGDDKDWAFGGTAAKHEYGVPVTVCKHILAALIAKAAPGLCGGNGTGVRWEVSEEEMAGWAAGWGDCG